jgi:methylated-DNA-[protein]-cysteine S-methyltransferase
VRVTRHRYAVDGWGVGELVVGDGLVLAHDLPEPGRHLDVEAASPQSDGLADRVVERVHAHLHGRRSSYEDVPLDLSWCSTAFQERLARELQAVPWGEIVSYGELAALAGRPGAARAAGTFCAQNRFSLLLPCHRVVSASGIGGYGSSGVALKRRLLALEGLDV